MEETDFLAFDFAPLDHSWFSATAFFAFSAAAFWFATSAFWTQNQSVLRYWRCPGIRFTAYLCIAGSLLRVLARLLLSHDRGAEGIRLC